MLRYAIDLFRKEQYMFHSDFDIFYYSDSEVPKVLPHKHNFFEIYYLRTEKLDYVVGNQVYHMSRGDFLLLPPGLLHYPPDLRLAPGQKYERVVLWCSVDFFELFTAFDPELNHMWDVVIQNGSYLIHPTLGASSNLYDLLLRLLSESNHQGYASKGMLSSIMMEIFVTINRITVEKKTLGKHSPSENLFSNIITYIHSHLSEELSLTTLSKHFFVSKGYISRLFRDYMGIPVHQYILSLRLEGCRTAIENGAPITKVVEMYGFQDYSSFYRAFKNTFLMSPKDYRNSLSAPREEQ